MAEEITITIHKDDLGPAKREFGITNDNLELVDDKGASRVKVFVNNELADAKATGDSVVVKAPPRPVKAALRPQEDVLTVVVTTKHDKVIKVLKYDPWEDYDSTEATIRKPVGDRKPGDKPPDAGAALIKAIGEAAQKIADAMAASKASSGVSTAVTPPDAPSPPTPPGAASSSSASTVPTASTAPSKSIGPGAPTAGNAPAPQTGSDKPPKTR